MKDWPLQWIRIVFSVGKEVKLLIIVYLNVRLQNVKKNVVDLYILDQMQKEHVFVMQFPCGSLLVIL